ncbi:MAG: type II toxin-antitoxin system prevent-host-death family antitoxin [bacterium]
MKKGAAIPMKNSAAIAELKAQLSRFLSRVKSGEEILVTERGKPIARIVPIRPGDTDIEHWRDLERQGLMRLGTGRLPKGFWDLPQPEDPGASVRAAVLEEREEGW